MSFPPTAGRLADVWFRCADCGKVMTQIAREGCDQTCSQCGFRAEWRNGVVCLLPSSQRSRTAAPNMSSLCSGSFFYQSLSDVKTAFERPAPFSIGEPLHGQRVLHLGCGPTLTGAHQNYDYGAASLLVGQDVSRKTGS